MGKEPAILLGFFFCMGIQASVGHDRYLTEMTNAGLPARHIEMTNLVVLDYDRSLHLSKVQAVGDASLLACTPADQRIEMSHAAG